MARHRRERRAAAKNPVKNDNKVAATSAPITGEMGFHSASDTGMWMTDPCLTPNGKCYDLSEIDSAAMGTPLYKFRKSNYRNSRLQDLIKAYEPYRNLHQQQLKAQKAQQEELLQLDLDLAAASPQDLSWQQIQAKDTDIPADINMQAQLLKSALEAVIEGFECSSSLDRLTDPMFSTYGCVYFNASAQEHFVGKGKVFPDLHLKKAINNYPKFVENFSALQKSVGQNASILAQKKEFLKKLQHSRSAPTATPTRLATTPGGAGTSPYRPALERPGPSPLSHPSGATAATASTPSLRTPGAEPAYDVSPEASKWRDALDAKSSSEFVKLITAADSEELTAIKIDGHSLAEYLALYSPWPPLPPIGSVQDTHNKKALLNQLHKKGVKLAPILKAATLGETASVKDLLKKNQNPRDGKGLHFLHYALFNNHKKLPKECGAKLSEGEIASGENLLRQHEKAVEERMQRLREVKKDSPIDTTIEQLDQSLREAKKDTTTDAAIAQGDQPKAIIDLVGGRKYGEIPLHVAAGTLQKGALEALILLKANIQERDHNGATALHHAARVDFVSGVQILLTAKTSIDAVDRHQCTPLHAAVIHGNIDVARMLITRKANINAVTTNTVNGRMDLSGSTPLYLAAKEGNAEMVKLLIEGRANLDIAGGEQKLTPLLATLNNTGNDTAIALALIDAKADVEAQVVGHTPLFFAVQLCDLRLARKLLGARANPNVAADSGMTPLTFATTKYRSTPQNQNKLMVELLVEAISRFKATSELQKQPSLASPSMPTLGSDQKASQRTASLSSALQNDQALLHSLSPQASSASERKKIQQGMKELEQVSKPQRRPQSPAAFVGQSIETVFRRNLGSVRGELSSNSSPPDDLQPAPPSNKKGL